MFYDQIFVRDGGGGEKRMPWHQDTTWWVTAGMQICAVWMTNSHIPKDQATGTFWYHSHDMMNGEEQVFGGMSGAIIVESLNRDLPPNLRHITEHNILQRSARRSRPSHPAPSYG